MRDFKKYGIVIAVTKEEQTRILSEAPALIEELKEKYEATNRSIEVKADLVIDGSPTVKFSVRDSGRNGEPIQCLADLVTGLGLEFDVEHYKKSLTN
jgi:hypothetical protein